MGGDVGSDVGANVGWLGLAASLIFVAIALAVTTPLKLQLNKPIVVAVGRSLVQMIIVGAALVPLVRPETPLFWSWLWVVGIVVFASWTVTRRAPQVPGLLWVSLLAHVVIAVSSLAIIFGFTIFDIEGRTIVPVAGMVIGNSMKAGVVAASRVAEFASDQRAEVEAGLALGMTTRTASRRLMRSSLRTAISSQVEQTAALGIVFLPGAMTGLILAGVDPMEAVRTQLALMYVILAGVVISAVVTGVGTLRCLTTQKETLVRLSRV